MEEVWKDVVGLEEYAMVSSLGNVMTKDRYIDYESYTKLLKGKKKTGTNNGLGYIQYKFTIKGKTFRKYEHVMVAEAFLGEGKGLEVNHIDGDKSNNCLNNLEWVTHKENIQHAIENSLIVFKEKKIIKKYCNTCKREFNANKKSQQYCSRKCVDNSFNINKDELYNTLKNNSFVAVGSMYGVTDNTIRKWCDKLGIPSKSSYYRKYKNKDA